MSTAAKGRTHGCTDQCCKREESSCQLGAVHTWHIATNPKAQNLRSVLMQSGHLWTSALAEFAANDPLRTSNCGMHWAVGVRISWETSCACVQSLLGLHRRR